MPRQNDAKHAAVAAAAAAVMLLAPASARAEGDGIVAGVGMGVGSVECGESCEDFRSGGGLNLHVGAMMAPRVAFVVDAWGLSHEEGTRELRQGLLTVGLQAWVVPRIWLRAGIGIGGITIRDDADAVDVMERDDAMPSLLFAAGLELITLGPLSLDVSVRAGASVLTEEDQLKSYQLAVGASWH